ncbi:MAG TPA: IPT/TIG domain-containing protein [Bryobacteraceae bacterium]|nr:IPT/TIG domain-containing protein [Bryobacteraceae bacterium]
MKRTIWLVIVALLVSTGIFAQTISTVDVSVNPPGAAFMVDGNTYITPQVFPWPTGSKHIIEFPLSFDQNGNPTTYQTAQNGNIEYLFGSWTANDGTLPQGNYISVTANPALTSVVANVTVQYLVTINFPNGTNTPNAPCAGAPASTTNTGGTPQGLFYMDGTCYGGSTSFFATAGSHTVSGYPYPGWVFYATMVNSLQAAPGATVDIEDPTTIAPEFSVAKRVNFITNPAGLNIIVDGTVVPTPNALSASSSGTTCAPDYTRLPPNAPPGFTPLCIGQFDFLPGSTHHIGAPVYQMDVTGQYWDFTAFDNGLGQNATYVAPYTTSFADTITAEFALGTTSTIMTNPQGLKVMIDGRDNWPGYNFIWAAGSTQTLNAESPQTDANGRVWTFTAWSDGGAQSHTITVPSGVSNFTVTASYAELDQVSVNSSPSALTFTIDGGNCVTPCAANKSAGSTSQIVAPATVSAGPGSQFQFVSWSDGVTTPTRTVTFSQNSLSLTANYQLAYQLTMVSNPAAGGTFTVTPASPSGYFLTGTAVTVAAAANNGYKFSHWEGALSGTLASGSLSMSSPQTVQADFATVPYIPPAGIQSVTGPTPSGAVAAGSLISIYGQNLAASLQVGPTNPLAQTINNVTVTVNSSLLPLVFVSPTQISAQVPWELQPGSYTLVVHQVGQPDVPGNFTVVRDAPGAFTETNSQNLPLVLALRPDGSVVSFSNPAQHGEQITIYATGLGPYAQPPVDGFPVTNNSAYSLLDPITVNTDSAQLQPDWAGAAAGIVGVQVVQLTITDDFPPSTNVNITIGANGTNSASVVLPVQ